MTQIEGYASLFWTRDLNDDVTAAGAFCASLARTGAKGVRMLCQHDGDHPGRGLGRDRRGRRAGCLSAGGLSR
jgi:phage head maturation protease